MRDKNILKRHEKLRHLTEAQMKELINLYQDKTIKLKDIIKKYNIDAHISDLRGMLPPIKIDENCEYCSEALYKELEGRSSYGHDVRNERFCINCGHEEKNEHWKKMEPCNCKRCAEIRELFLQNQLNKIAEVYDKEHEKIEFEKMEFKYQLDLLYILRKNSSNDPSKIFPIQTYDIYEKKKWLKKINRLMEKNVISVAPDSDIETFEESNFPYRVYLDKATYNLNVVFAKNTMQLINTNQFFSNTTDGENKIEVLKEFIYEDAILQFSRLLNKRRLELHISESANDRFIELIDKISYTQLVYLCFRVARHFGDLVNSKEIIRKIAINGALPNVSKFYERSISLGWELDHWEYEKSGEELRFYIERILGKPLRLLRDVASLEALENCPDIENNYEKSIWDFDN